MSAISTIQRWVRGHRGRRKYQIYYIRTHRAIPIIQRVFRGHMGRKHYYVLKAKFTISKFFMRYGSRAQEKTKNTKKNIKASQLLTSITPVAQVKSKTPKSTTKTTTTTADATILQGFIVRRAVRCLERHFSSFLLRKKKLQEIGALRMRKFVSASRIQHWYKRIKALYKSRIRLEAAIQIQRRAKGMLTRFAWSTDPGIDVSVQLVSRKTGFVYSKGVLNQIGKKSYSIIRKKTRLNFAAREIQRIYRGYCGKRRSNAAWVAMQQRWEYLVGHTDLTVEELERHKRLLPKAFYHPSKKYHMRKPNAIPGIRTGYLYEYQNIIDMMEDMDEKRQLTVPNPEYYQGDRQDKIPVKEPYVSTYSKDEDAIWHFSVDDALTRSEPPDTLGDNTIHTARPCAHGVSDDVARLPIGSKVTMDMLDGKFHTGVIERVNQETQCFHVEFLKVYNPRI